jgi:hypothetical protein
VGFAAKGLGCFYAQSTKKSSGGGLANTMGLIQVKKGKVSKTELEAALKKSFQGDWEWSAKEIDSGRFVVNFPNAETLSRVLDFEEFTLKGSGLAISVARWNAATLAKAKLFSVWVKIGGIPDDRLHYKGICEAASPLGVVQMIDVPALTQYRVASVKIGVRDPSMIPASIEITTDPYVYDAFYEMEEVVEKGGLLDENGEVIEGTSQSHLMDVDNDSPTKKRKGADVEGENSQYAESEKEGFFITKEKLMQFIKDETEFRVGFELQQMEERLLAAQLRNNMNARQNEDMLREKEKTPPKDKPVFEEDGDEFS